jgi:hypothetical protein
MIGKLSVQVLRLSMFIGRVFQLVQVVDLFLASRHVHWT